MNPRSFGVILLIFTMFFWGSTFTLVKRTIQIIPIDGFITLRFFFAFIFIFLFSLTDISQLSGLKNKKVWRGGFILGSILYVSYWFQTEGLDLTTPSKAAFITGFNVVLVPIIGYFQMKQKISRIEWISSFIALNGLALIFLDFSNITNINQGDLLVFVTAISIAYHVLMTQKYVDEDITSLVLVQMLTISLLSLIVSLVRNSYWVPDYFALDIVWITFGITAIFATAFAFLSQTYAQHHGVPSSQIAMIFILEPIFALLIDVYLKVIPSIQVLAGMGLLLMGIVFSIRFSSNLQDEKPENRSVAMQ